MQLGLVMMALGVFRFGMAGGSYQQFSRTAGYRWQRVDRIGRARKQIHWQSGCDVVGQWLLPKRGFIRKKAEQAP